MLNLTCLMPDLFLFEPTAYDCRCCENDSPLPEWPARWVFVLLRDFCCDWSLKIKSGKPVIKIEAFTAIYRRACIWQPYLVSFQATISRQFFFFLFSFRRWSVIYVLCVSSQAMRWSGTTVQRWGWAFNTCTLLTISRRFSNYRTNWSRAHERTMMHVTEDSEENVTHLLQDHRTSRGAHWIVRCQMFWKYHTETFKQTFLFWKKFYIKRGLVKFGVEEAVSIL